MMRTTLVAAALSIWGAVAPAAAPPVQIAIRDGRVWLKADGATVADVLREWARVGGTAVVDGERLPRTLVSLHLEAEPEQEALEILLRGVGGFVTVGRAASRLDTGASRFERIVVVPSTAQPAATFAATPAVRAAAVRTEPAAPVPAPVYTASGAQRVIGSDGLLVPDDQEDAPPVRATPTSIPPGFSPPSGPTPGATPPTPAPPAPPGVITPPRPGPSVPPPGRPR
jgi:hypothetical protein